MDLESHGTREPDRGKQEKAEEEQDAVGAVRLARGLERAVWTPTSWLEWEVGQPQHLDCVVQKNPCRVGGRRLVLRHVPSEISTSTVVGLPHAQSSRSISVAMALQNVPSAMATSVVGDLLHAKSAMASSEAAILLHVKSVMASSEAAVLLHAKSAMASSEAAVLQNARSVTGTEIAYGSPHVRNVMITRAVPNLPYRATRLSPFCEEACETREHLQTYSSVPIRRG